MLGPVQLIIIGFKGSQVPDEVRVEVCDLLASRAVRLIDALVLVMRADRTLGKIPPEDLLPGLPETSGKLVDSLLIQAAAASTVAETTSGGRGYLFKGDQIPDLRRTMPAGTGAIGVLLEHLWANPLRDAVVRSDATPMADAWIGRTALQSLNLAPAESH